MTAIKPGRWTARFEEPHVVFIIGMRINKPWKLHRWFPLIPAMGRMLTELYTHPELGFLGGNTWFGRTFVLVQYWRSFEHLEAYAKARDKQHLPAWSAFNRAVGNNGDVGIYHETYCVAPGQYENVYVNMPPTLLGEVAPLVPVSGGRSSARGRMAAHQPEPV
jgi:hypothetical protein